MPEYYSSGREPRRNYDERSVRSGARPANARPASARPANARPANARPANARPAGARPANARPAARPPQGSRPTGSRPPQNRRPAPRRRRRTQPRFYVIIAAIVILLVVALILILGGGKGKDPSSVVVQATPTPATSNSGMSNATVNTMPGDFAADMASDAAIEPASDTSSYSTLGDWLDDEDAEVAALSSEEMVQTTDLSINPNLPKDWTNILLLGTDERTLSESARTDAMLICSINPSTGEVKLTSIMRDIAVSITDAGKHNGTYRINSANYFGGPKYAMKIVNECFDMNIQHYVTVNFFGFQKIAQALGGIDVDITQAEMEEINKKAVNQARVAFEAGIDESDQINEYLTEYGPNTHLNGRQTLAYARVRYVDSDFSRTERQRTVLVKLMDKLRGKSAAEIIALIGSLSDQVQTNMNLDDIANVAIKVLQSGLSDVDTLRLPINGTYKEERRNNKSMMYDTDWATNSRELYNFIYG